MKTAYVHTFYFLLPPSHVHIAYIEYNIALDLTKNIMIPFHHMFSII